ncbi:hypothetical protein Tco_0960954 [Tanacetum coccineum]
MDKHGSRLYKLDNLDILHQVSKAVDEIVTDGVDWAIQAPLRDRFRDLPEAYIKEILHHRMWESNSYKAHEDHKKLYEALEQLMARDHTDQLLTNLAEARKKKKKRHDSPKTPPGSPPHQPPLPPPPAGLSGTSGTSRASRSSQLPPPPPPPFTNQSDQSTSTAALSSSKTAASAEYMAWTTTDTRLRPFVSSILEDLHMDDDTAPDEQVHSSSDEDIGHDHIPMTGDMAIFMDWFCKKQGITELKQQDLEGPAYEIFKDFHPNWFQRQRFYIDRHTYEGNRKAVRTHMRILSVVRIEVFSLYGYDYMKKIILRRADLKEYTIAERDFKFLYPSDFEDLYLLNLQGHLNYLPPEDKKILTIAVNLWTRNLVIRQRVEDFQLGIESYQTQLNLTKPRWDATGFEFKHDFIIDEALDYRVKEFQVNGMNLGLNTRFWTRKDVDRSKEFMFAIQKLLKTRRIFRNLESFVGGRIKEGDYRLRKRTE